MVRSLSPTYTHLHIVDGSRPLASPADVFHVEAIQLSALSANTLCTVPSTFQSAWDDRDVGTMAFFAARLNDT